MKAATRFLIIAAFYLATSLGAGAARLALFFLTRLWPSDSFEPAQPYLTLIVVAIALANGSCAAFGLLPALVAILYSEQKGIRSFWVHTYAGAVIGPIGYLLYLGALTIPARHKSWSALLLQNSFSPDRVGLWAVMAPAGFVGGSVYRLFAGRTAGVLVRTFDPRGN